MKKLLLSGTTALFMLWHSPPLLAQVAPGWIATGEWQCGPVRIITSRPANGTIANDFYVIGAWFDNHFTLYGGDVLYYNGVPCQTITYPLPRPRPHAKAPPVDKDEWGMPKEK